MRIRLLSISLFVVSFSTFTGCSKSDEEISQNLRCEVGTYRMESGALIDIGLSSTEHLRWRTPDGQVGRVRLGDERTWAGTEGWTSEPHPARITLGDCQDQTIQVTGIAGVEGTGQMLKFDQQETSFQGQDVELAGRLILPVGKGAVPLVVLVHGSESSSALDYSFHQRMLPAQGIGIFVYDKRGTGASSGEYSQDFHLLAADAAAAYRTAQKLAGSRVSASGYFGGSQGSWVAPLASTISSADFVIASFGMAEGPLAEDRDEVQIRLREAGYDEDTLAKAREITDATGRLLASDFQQGHEELERVIDAYSEEEWFAHLEGGITWDMVIRPLWMFQIGYFFLDVGTSWNYEPVPILKSVDTPMLFVLGGKDRSAPPTRTRAILTDLQAQGREIDVAFYPNAAHGIMQFVEDKNGERQTLGYEPSYMSLVVDWIKHRQFRKDYPGAELAAGARKPPPE